VYCIGIGIGPEMLVLFICGRVGYPDDDHMETWDASKEQDFMERLVAELRDMLVEDEVIGMVKGKKCKTHAEIMLGSVVGVESHTTTEVYTRVSQNAHWLLLRCMWLSLYLRSDQKNISIWLYGHMAKIWSYGHIAI
jgi:hypothetical protein